jgi:outer membrane usher protein
MIRFQTVGGRAILIRTHLADGSVVPFGASVFDAQGSEVGLAGQDGGIYLRGIAETGTLSARWGTAADQKCSFGYQLPPKQKDDGPFVRIDARCEVDPPSLNTENDSGKADPSRITGQR